MKKIFGVLFLMVMMITIGCINDILNPDIEAVRISPLGYYIIDGVRTVPIDTIALVARNSQDCHITEFLWEFYDFEDNLIYAAPEPFPLSIKIRGIVDSTQIDTTYIYGLVVQTDTLSNYIFNSGLMSAKIKYRFVAEADYFTDRTDTTDIYIGLYRVTVLYLTNIDANPDSIPRDGISVTKITAAAQDFAGDPLIGANLQFSIDDPVVGRLSAICGITGSDGNASVYLFSNDTGSQPAMVWVTVSHPYASYNLTIPVRFYIPEP